MIKYFCDGCGDEVKSRELNTFSWLCHLTKITKGNYSYHVDRKLNPISGRSDSVELCNKCYNEVVIESVNKLFELFPGLKDKF
jgi:hypothetical protein